MNIKEISKMAGKNETTIQRWIKKIPDAKRIELDAKCIEAGKTQKPADFTLEETIAIIRAGGNETLADLLMENAKSKEQSAEVITLNNRDMVLISAVIEKTVLAVVKTFKNEGIFREVKTTEQTGGDLVPLPAPVISIRSKIIQLVNNYANRTGTEHHVIYGWLYSDFYYIYHVNVRVQANNRGIKPIDFIEQEGLMPQLLAIAEQRCA